MGRTTFVIGVALLFGATHATNANAQEDGFEITLDVVLDDVEDIDGVVMSVIEDELERSEMEQEFVGDHEFEARFRDEEPFIDGDGQDADEYDDGQFDEYDDGEEIETAEDEQEPFEEQSNLEEPDDTLIDEPGID